MTNNINKDLDGKSIKYDYEKIDKLYDYYVENYFVRRDPITCKDQPVNYTYEYIYKYIDYFIYIINNKYNLKNS